LDWWVVISGWGSHYYCHQNTKQNNQKQPTTRGQTAQHTTESDTFLYEEWAWFFSMFSAPQVFAPPRRNTQQQNNNHAQIISLSIRTYHS
jgi:hypothetical protein